MDDKRDAMRYRWLRDNGCLSLWMEKNEHKINYTTAKETIERDQPRDFEDESPEMISRMIETDSIWRLHVYPRTPVGFYQYFGATLDDAIDAAMANDSPIDKAGE